MDSEKQATSVGSRDKPIGEIRKQHDALYKAILGEVARLNRQSVSAVTDDAGSGARTASSPHAQALEHYIQEAEQLLESISTRSSNPGTVEDYLWLFETAILWEYVFSSMLNRPKTVVLSRPPQDLLPSLPKGNAFSEEELTCRVGLMAKIVSGYRKQKRYRMDIGKAEQDWDWHQAEVCLANDILDGVIDFARRVGALSYPRLEQIWMFEVLELLAYLEWNHSGHPLDISSEAFYFKACAQVRERLLAFKQKASFEQFGEAKKYIEETYLTSDSTPRLDYTKLDAAGAYNIIKIKSERIREIKNRYGDQNWYDAEFYVRKFYENIIPAVMTGDSKSIRTVLDAFHFSIENRLQIVNCFEMALAVYFLKSADVKEFSPF